MKILAVSNFYPPYYIGGYELGCCDVLSGLKARGHEVRVLTSTHGIGHPHSDGEVYRWLNLMSSRERSRTAKLAEKVLRQPGHCRSLMRLLRAWQPDVLYFWNLAGLSINLPLIAQSRGIPLCYFISDQWLLNWEAGRWYEFWCGNSPGWPQRLARRLVFPLGGHLGIVPTHPINLTHVQFASDFLQRSAIKVRGRISDAEVIHWGINLDDFPFRETRRIPSRLLFVGQITPEKGVSTAIEAMAVLVHECHCASLQLTITGTNAHQPQYVQEMRRLVDHHGLSEHVKFTSFLPRGHLSRVYRDHDILIFPSVWEEPFSIVVLEAMASGLVLVGTHTGGSSEVMHHEVNSLVFPKGDARSCATQVLRLLNDVNLYESLRKSGRRGVEEEFSLDAMLDRIEVALAKAARKDPVREQFFPTSQQRRARSEPPHLGLAVRSRDDPDSGMQS